MALIEAAGNGHLAIVRLLLTHGADPRERQGDGTRALDWAAQNGHQDIVELLLAHDPQVLELPGYNDRTALAAAAGNGHLALVELLLARGADPRTRLKDGTRALDWAAAQGHQDVVERLVRHDRELLDLPGVGEHTPLMLATGAGQEGVVRTLLALGVGARRRMPDGSRPLDWAAQEGHGEIVDLLLAHDPTLLNLPGYHDRTALAVACGSGHLSVVERLLAAGADPRRRLNDGARALDWAAAKGRQGIVERLLAHDPSLLELPGAGGCTALMAAAGRGHTPLVDLLLARGADPSVRVEDGMRALDWAAQGGHLAAVERLLAQDPGLLELPGYRDRTVLAAAAGNGHLDLTQWLLARGADPRARLKDGTRALDWAAQEGHEAVVEALAAHDPDLLDLPGGGSHVALMLAAGKGHTGVVRVLLARGADPRRRVPDGTRALDWAAQEGHAAVVDLILAHAPQTLDLPGFHERTALAAAAGNGHGALVATLLARGADPRKRAKQGMHALDWAAARGHRAIVERLLAHDPELLDLPGVGERTALIAAAAGGHEDIVELLLARGADPLKRSADGETVLDGVVQREHWAILDRLIAHTPALWDAPLGIEAHSPGADELSPGFTLSGNGRLIDALIVRRHPGRVRALLESHPERIDAAGVRGATPLMLAAATSQDELLCWLLWRGADPARCDAQGDHALLYALDQRAVECARILIEREPRLMYRVGARGRRPSTLVSGMSRSPALRALFEAHGAPLPPSPLDFTGRLFRRGT